VPCVAGCGEIDTETDQDSICMVLTLVAIVLRWTKTDDGAVVEVDGDATITPE
jgi:hypothetical protein